MKVMESKTCRPYALKLFDRRQKHPRISKTRTSQSRDVSAHHIVLREVRLVRCCTGCPNIIQLVDVIIMPNHQWGIVMDFCRFGTLHSLCQKQGMLSFADALVVTRSILSALTFLMDISMVHRDVKMDNILIADTRRKSRLDFHAESKLCDFGLAAFEWETEQMKRRCGTPGYVAPEIVCGHTYGCDSDVFSVAVCLYRMVCGQLPFRGETIRDILHTSVIGAFVPPSRCADLASHRAWRVITSLGHIKKRSRPNALEAYRYVSHVLRELMEQNASRQSLGVESKDSTSSGFRSSPTADVSVYRKSHASNLQLTTGAELAQSCLLTADSCNASTPREWSDSASSSPRKTWRLTSPLPRGKPGISKLSNSSKKSVTSVVPSNISEHTPHSHVSLPALDELRRDPDNLRLSRHSRSPPRKSWDRTHRSVTLRRDPEYVRSSFTSKSWRRSVQNGLTLVTKLKAGLRAVKVTGGWLRRRLSWQAEPNTATRQPSIVLETADT